MGPQIDHVVNSSRALFRDNHDQSEDRRQPWRAFWPLASRNTNCGIWANSEHPEVTSFKFDSKRPFDRPWREWTRTAAAKSELCNVPLKSQEKMGKGTLQPGNGISDFDRNV
jgi:hypothetical protein